MTTAGLNAFLPETQAEIERLIKKPIDRFGQPIFCRSCTDKMGRGAASRCPRRGSATEGACPFRDAHKTDEA